MIYKQFKDLKLSMLGMGNMRLPTKGEGFTAPIDKRKAQAIIDYAMTHGVNYYDTAYVYHGGESEKFLGEALSKYPRDSYYLATKFFIVANPDYKAVFEEQIRRLKTDHIDFYMLHGLFDNTTDQYLDCGCIEYFLEQQKASRIGYLGFSSHASTENLERAASHHNWDFAQIQLNYLDWKHASAKREYEILTERGIPVMVMEPVRGGRLASLNTEGDALLRGRQPDWSIPSWAFRWLMRLPNVQVILSGMTHMDQIEDNVATFEDGTPLTDEQTELLMKACDLVYGQMSVPCTACRYCCEACPQELNIPKLMDVYNKHKLGDVWALSENTNKAEGKKPSDCVSCGACTAHCPQGIDIPDIMRQLAEAGAQM